MEKKKMSGLEKGGIIVGIGASLVAIGATLHDSLTKKKQIKYKAECDAYYAKKIKDEEELQKKLAKQAKAQEKKNTKTKTEKTEEVNSEKK